jgi:hypothetical protein
VLEHVKGLEREVTALKGKLASAQGDELLSQAQDIKGVKLLVARWTAPMSKPCATPWTSSRTS